MAFGQRPELPAQLGLARIALQLFVQGRFRIAQIAVALLFWAGVIARSPIS
jgi:hypothetical protein